MHRINARKTQLLQKVHYIARARAMVQGECGDEPCSAAVSPVFSGALQRGMAIWYDASMRHRFPKKGQPQGSGSPMDAALKFLGYSARSVREVERHLDERNYGEVEVYDTVERLKEHGLLNDRAFAEAFISTRLTAKPISRRRLQEQLLAHELPREVVEEAIAAVSDEAEAANALAVAEKYARQFEALPGNERARRVMQRLLARGYGYDDAETALEKSLDALDTAE